MPLSISISLNLKPKPIVLCDANPHLLISSFVTALEGLATQSNTQMKLKFIEAETVIKKKLFAKLEQLNQRRKPAERMPTFVTDCIVKVENDLSQQFMHMQKNQLLDSQEQFERYCNV